MNFFWFVTNRNRLTFKTVPFTFSSYAAAVARL